MPSRLLKPKRLLSEAATLIFIILSLSACATGSSNGSASTGSGIWTSPLPPLMTPQPSENRSGRADRPAARTSAEIQLQRQQQGQAAEILLQEAEDAEGHEQQQLLLEAAETALRAGRLNLVAEALSRLEDARPAMLTREEKLRLTLVEAEMGKYADRPLSLLNLLPRPGPEFNPQQAARIWHLRSEAHLALGRSLQATQALVKREAFLPSGRAVHDNRQLIWRTLRSVPPSVLDARELAAADIVTRGWVELAQIMLDLWLSPSELTSATSRWENQYPDHPAHATVLASRPVPQRQPRMRTASFDGKLDKIALLLPLTGSYAVPATAIRDGFMVAYYARPQPRADVLVYDTAGNPDSVPNLARQAMAAGADIIVGPLTKESVAALTAARDINIPTLTLNYLDDGVQAPANFYQFGLSPEDEARQAAARALQDGYTRGLALAPRSSWGTRTLTAFNEELVRLGGSLVDYAYYNPEERDYAAPITQLLRYDRARAASIDAAQKRRRERAADDGSVIPLSAIRSDMDFIFLASRPEEARLIRPQLRFYRASAVPVYATSHVYTGNPSPRQDQDLDGIQFGDTPWTLAPAGAMAQARDEVSRLWPATHAQYPRLYAMGYDAFALASRLGQGEMRGGFGFPGATGLLTLEADGRISRDLQWARFGGGQPRLLSDTPAISPMPMDRDFR